MAVVPFVWLFVYWVAGKRLVERRLDAAFPCRKDARYKISV